MTALLGLDFADMDAAEAAEWVAARPAQAPFGYVVTPNADHLVRLARDRSLTPIYRGALLCLLDSRVVAVAGHLRGRPMPKVAPGSDVTALLLTRHLHPGERILVIGLPDPAIQALTRRIGIALPLHLNPPMGFASDPAAINEAVAFVLANPARLIFLATGSPQQERLAAAIAASGGATGTALCVGASLAFLAGTDRRAPTWMQRNGLEWLFRLIRNPRRLARRYLLHSPAVFWLLLRR